MIDLYILLVGIFSGMLGTLLGLGGGTFTLPILVIVLKMDIHSAISLSLVSMVAKSILSTAMNFSARFINIQLGLMLTPAALLGSTIGGRLGLTSSEAFLSILFAFVLLVASLLVYLKRKPSVFFYNPESSLSGTFFDGHNQIQYSPRRLKVAVFISLLGGFFGGMLGIGGGGILVPIMKLINGIPMKVAAATSVFVIGFSSMLPAFLYYRKGVLIPEYAVFILVGIFFGAVLGNKLLKVIKDKHIAKIFSITLIIISSGIIYNVIRIL